MMAALLSESLVILISSTASVVLSDEPRDERMNSVVSTLSKGWPSAPGARDTVISSASADVILMEVGAARGSTVEGGLSSPSAGAGGCWSLVSTGSELSSVCEVTSVAISDLCMKLVVSSRLVELVVVTAFSSVTSGVVVAAEADSVCSTNGDLVV